MQGEIKRVFMPTFLCKKRGWLFRSEVTWVKLILEIIIIRVWMIG